MKHTYKLSLAMLALIGSCAAQAQVAGSLMARVGITQVSPSVSSGDLSAPSFIGSKVDVQSSTVLGGGVTYMVNDHLALDLPLATPLRHNIVGAGSVAGVGKLGDTKALPITLLAQYRFGEALSQFRPYVGAGVTYAKFYGERGTNTLTALSGGTPTSQTGLGIASKFAPTLQIGASMALNAHWFVDASVTKTWLKTQATLTSGQTLDLRLDPMGLAVAVGYRY